MTLNYQDDKMVNTGRYKPPVYQRGYGGYKPPVYQRGRGFGSNLLHIGQKLLGRGGKTNLLNIGKAIFARKIAPALISKAKKEIVNQAMKRSSLVGNLLKNQVFRSGNQNTPRSRGGQALRQLRRAGRRRRRRIR